MAAQQTPRLALRTANCTLHVNRTAAVISLQPCVVIWREHHGTDAFRGLKRVSLLTRTVIPSHCRHVIWMSREKLARHLEARQELARRFHASDDDRCKRCLIDECTVKHGVFCVVPTFDRKTKYGKPSIELRTLICDESKCNDIA